MAATFSLRVVLVALLAFLTCNAEAGPFGLEMGMPLSKLNIAKATPKPGIYELRSVPNPHSAFESYIVQVSPSAGLCWIKALGRTLEVSAYGTELKSAFDDLKARLASNYGVPSQELDVLLPKSIWNEPRDWMMGLRKKERMLMAMWEKSLPSSLRAVYIAASALSSSRGYVAVEYAFTNEASCEAELRKKEDGAL